MAVRYYFDRGQALQRVSVIYGNTNDFYMTLTNGWYALEPLLASHLKAMGCQVVVFYAGGKTIRCYDREHAENRLKYFPLPSEKKKDIDIKEEEEREIKPAPEKARATVSAPAGAGVMRKKMPRVRGVTSKSESRPATDAEPEIPMSVEYREDRIPDYLDQIMRNGAVRSCVVLSNAGSFLDNEHRQLAATVYGWYGIEGRNTNQAILLFQELSLEATSASLQVIPSWRFLYENVFSKSAPRDARIRVGLPREDEIFYLLNVYMPQMGSNEELSKHHATRRDVVMAAERLVRRSSKRQLVDLRNFIMEHAEDPLGDLLSAYGPQTEEDALEKIRSTEGWETVAVAVERIVENALRGQGVAKRKPPARNVRSNLRMAHEQPDIHYDVNLSLVLMGSPGTGKTTVAGLIGEVFRQRGLLTSGHVVKVTRADLVAGYVGQTAIKTRERIEEARGGVLFVDEAYSLYRRGVGGESNDFGIEAVETILEAMTSMRGELCVIFAGYTKEMTQLLTEANSGLMRRFEGNIIEIPDYKPVLLEHIMLERIQEVNNRNRAGGSQLRFLIDGRLAFPEGGQVDPIAPDELKPLVRAAREANAALGPLSVWIDNWYDDRQENLFGNAGAAVELADRLMGSAINRANALSYDVVIRRDDFDKGTEKQFECRRPTVAQVEEQLRDVIGMEDVKQTLRRIAQYLQMARTRRDVALEKRGEAEESLRVEAGSYLFVGNPGVGKTMIADKLALTLSGLGIIRRYKPIRVTGLDLINRVQHEGISGLKKFIENCKGAVLVIDEAHQLATYDVGSVVVKALLDPMIEWSDQMCFVFCCYPEDRASFLSVDQGLSRRINDVFVFKDYTPEEVLDIFRLKLKQKHYTAAEGAFAAVLDKLRELESAPEPWENGAIAEKLLKQACVSQSLRMLEGTDYTAVTEAVKRGDVQEEELYRLTEEDILSGFNRMLRTLSLKNV